MTKSGSTILTIRFFIKHVLLVLQTVFTCAENQSSVSEVIQMIISSLGYDTSEQESFRGNQGAPMEPRTARRMFRGITLFLTALRTILLRYLLFS